MRVIGVIDLLGGGAVHAVAGRRDHYEAIRQAAGTQIPAGSASALAQTYTDRCGLSELYVADLDAIRAADADEPAEPGLDRQGIPHGHSALITELSAVSGTLWLDAGISSIARARAAVGLGATTVVVGLETLPSYEALRWICDGIGGKRVAFSLDLRDGRPVVRNGGVVAEPAAIMAARAASAGAGAVIVIDLARVGTGRGLDYTLIERVREATPGVTLLAGGGVSGPQDLERLFAAGCDGALVASALHDGRLSASDVTAASRLARGSPA